MTNHLLPALSELHTRPIVEAALREDIGWGDISSQVALPADTMAQAEFVARSEGVLAGIGLAHQALCLVDSDVTWHNLACDGDRVEAGQPLARVVGRARSLLAAERVALNFVQRLSGIATLTARYVAAVAGTGARIADTRKTTPGLRLLEKYAVRCGGGVNHRFGLADAVMLKDNHLVAIAAQGETLAGVVARARASLPHTIRIEIEIDRLDQLDAVLEAGPDIILLDNMSPEQLAAAVRQIAGRAISEASGGVNLATVRRIAESGVDIISVGALTHSAPALDIGLDFSVTHDQ